VGQLQVFKSVHTVVINVLFTDWVVLIASLKVVIDVRRQKGKPQFIKCVRVKNEKVFNKSSKEV